MKTFTLSFILFVATLLGTASAARADQFGENWDRGDHFQDRKFGDDHFQDRKFDDGTRASIARAP